MSTNSFLKKEIKPEKPAMIADQGHSRAVKQERKMPDAGISVMSRCRDIVAASRVTITVTTLKMPWAAFLCPDAPNSAVFSPGTHGSLGIIRKSSSLLSTVS